MGRPRFEESLHVLDYLAHALEKAEEERDQLRQDLARAQHRIDTVSEMVEKVDRERVLYRDTLKGIERLASRWRDDERPDVVACGRSVRIEFILNGVEPESLKKPEGIGDKCDQCGADVMAENKYYTGSTFGPRTLCTKCWEAPQPQVTYDHE